MYRNFEEVIAAMSIASVKKVRECVEAVVWKQQAVSDALTESDLNVEALCSETDNGELKTVNFYCTTTFEYLEIPGILSPWFSCLYVEATFDKVAGKHRYDIGYGPKGMLSTEDFETWYDAEYLCEEFDSGTTDFDINHFVCRSFDFSKFCKAYGVKKVANSDTGEELFSNEE